VTIVTIHFPCDREFQAPGTETPGRAGNRSKIRGDLADKIERILSMLDAATTPQALDLPGYRLHRLKGHLKGYGLSPFAPTGALFSALKTATPMMASWLITIRKENKSCP